VTNGKLSKNLSVTEVARREVAAVAAAFLWLLAASPAIAVGKKHRAQPQPAHQVPVAAKPAAGLAEARLIEIYNLTGKARNREALALATALVEELPNFQLAQLVYGDLLLAQTRPVTILGDVPQVLAKEGAATLSELREESLRRIKALRDRPQPGTVPSQFLALSQRSKHAIAVDTSRSRLYLFENTLAGLKLLDDYYISVGKAGTSKDTEGDQRTPLGVYYINSNLDRKTLKDFYGSGALPINYPNVLDAKRGKTGGGIWLHGTPPSQFSRPPMATDGCVVLANPDLEHIIRTVEVRSTPVIIATQLQWVPLQKIRTEGKPFEDALQAWRNAKTAGDLGQILSYYTADFNSNGKTLDQWTPSLKTEISETQGRTIQLKDVSYLRWTDTSDTMVVTFGEVADGTRAGRTKRQYWTRQDNRWKIFFEGTM
jgi:murein L,D-transpeptidase YafK